MWDTDRAFSDIAHALARGYTDLYYVNIATDEFIEYHNDDASGVLTEARRGSDFFEGCERDARFFVHEDDQELFVRTMDPVFLSKALEDNDTYEFSYRRFQRGRTFWVSMAVTRAEPGGDVLVLAVSDTDELARQREAEERVQEERIIYARLHALTGNFITVYVIDPETDAYREFSSTESYTESFKQAKEGADFFSTVRNVAPLYAHPDDLERFLDAFTKEKVLASIADGGIFTLDYRLIMDGKPLFIQMKAAMVEEREGSRLIVGLNDVDTQYRQREIDHQIAREREVFDQITASLAEQYDTLYYIDIATSTYLEISSTDDYKRFNVPATGNDFFTESRRSIRKYVHPDDQERVLALHYKDVMLDNLKDQGSFSMAWRLVVDGTVRHIRHTEIMAKDKRHIIVCIKNINQEVQARRALRESQRKTEIYTQIAERLADHYDIIYYINCETSQYEEYSTIQVAGEFKIQHVGDSFFENAYINAARLIHAEDRERIRLFLDRDHLISGLEEMRRLTQDYRMLLDSGKIQYTRMSVTYSSDQSHFIICIENRDSDVRKEREHLAALTTANEMARRDELTHTKNKTAFREMERSLQADIDASKPPFGIVVLDINGLKLINDTRGHKAGDEYIKACCALICNTFVHSPVFRIGGDEFATVLKGQDFENREALIAGLREQVEESIRIGEGPSVASGLACYRPDEDTTVESVFNRADRRMYENKKRLKDQERTQAAYPASETSDVKTISVERKTMLDTLYKALEIVAEGTYVYLCDMRYDYSRWSKAAVDLFGMPSEYMYGAGDIWEDRIHPEDRETYSKGIDEIFRGTASDHDMQYRARRTTGQYDVCTCRGMVIRDPHGNPDYFVGAIRDHSVVGQIDTLTGMKNQYAFFEDIDAFIRRTVAFSAILFGISKFSEINEMYGYRFGNRVLQRYARHLLETLGNVCRIYRIDGTKFALLSTSHTILELKDRYDDLRASLHGGFVVEGKSVLLDLNCGGIAIKEFGVDSQTVYACLNYANTESKVRQQGELVEFQNGLSEQNYQRLEKLHAIRASIMHGHKGFYLLYQPVVDAKTEELIGAEALLRWKDPRYGMVPPDQFIPILETDPLFCELGEWIIWESVIAARQVLAHHPKFTINVNLSYTQLERPDFADMVLRILDDLRFPPEHLCLEVTERCRLLDMDLLKNVLASLRARGIRVALDDFGTGFSSVGILKEIPFDTVKIDRSFVKRINESDTDRKIVQNIADLATIFNAKVCVEGIETETMRDVLMAYHVGSFQGYYYARPLPLEELLAWGRDKA